MKRFFSLKSVSFKLKSKIILTLSCVVILTAAFLNVLYHLDNKYTKKTELLQDGVCLVTETGISFLVDGWEFYPDRLLTAQDFADGSISEGPYITSLGDYPNLAPFHKNRNPYGVSTYRLRIRGCGLYSLYLQEPLCAVKILIDGEMCGENGTVSQEGYQPLVRDIICQFAVDGETELIIQTANYSHYYGGLYYPPAIGDAGSINRMLSVRIIFYSLLCFFSAALALFSTAVWLGRKGQRDTAAFYFGLLSLFFSLRVCYPFLRLLGVPLVRLLYALEDTAALAVLYCTVRIALLLFAPGLQKRMHTCICAVTMGMCGAGFVIPLLILPAFPAFTTWYGTLISWYKLFAALLLIGTALYGVLLKRPHAGFSLAAVTAYGVCLFASVFLINEFEPIRAGWPDEYGSFLLVLLFGVIMVRRSRQMAEDNLRLTEHLQEAVDEKTRHLTLLLQERSQLMAELGHDLKSPVTSLSNMVQIIRLNNILLDHDTQEKIQIMEERCNILADRIRSIQRLTTETSGLPKMHTLSLNHFLSEFHHNLHPVIEMSGSDFVCSLTQLPCRVLADPDKLQRALENLVLNAADFTPPDGSIKLTLERESSRACIRISDNGCGIDENAVSRVFDRFYTTRASQGGQGLGLSITKSIITEHRGEITVSSKIGVGTVFTIWLPLLD